MTLHSSLGRLILIFAFLLVITGEAQGAHTASIGFFNKKSFAIDIEKADTYEVVFLIKHVAQSLIEEDRFGRITPSVAEYWTISKDMKTYTFQLHDSLFFHNGDKVTAFDVEHSLNVVRRSRSNPMNYYLKRIKRISVINQLKIEIELVSPWVGFLQSLSSGLVPIFSKSDFLNKGKFTGSGPYELVNAGESFSLVPYRDYRGIYPAQDLSFTLLPFESSESQPDIVLGYLRKKTTQLSHYNRTEIDSFTTYNFMVNPSNSRWKHKVERLKLIKLLVDAKVIITSKWFEDLRDIIPKGMLGHDITYRAYGMLSSELADVKLKSMSGEKIVVASLGAIPGFEKYSSYVQKKYGIIVLNKVVEGSDYLTQLRALSESDVFAVGWASIFSHPDATFIPFYLLGIELFDLKTKALIDRISHTNNLGKQYSLYRNLTAHLITEGYMLPHAQITTIFYINPSLDAPRSRYRYTLHLSEIRRKAG